MPLLWMVLLGETFGKDRSQFVSCRNLEESQILSYWHGFSIAAALPVLAIRREGFCPGDLTHI